MFVYEGHWIKINVTETRKVKNPYSCNLCSSNNPGSMKHLPRSFHIVWGFRIWRIEWRVCYLYHVNWTEVTMH